MNKKGITTGGITIGAFIITAVALIVGLTLFSGSIAGNIGTLTQTIQVTNETITAPAAGGNTTLRGQAATSFIATNATSGAVIPSTNYTITNYNLNSATGVIEAKLTIKAGTYAGQPWNVSYIYEPLGYVKESGGRTIAGLVGIFVALAILVVALVPSLRGGLSDLVKG